MNTKIDFVITWVDGNDPKWQEIKNRYTPSKASDINKTRYRDWDTLHYLFRGIEKFAPWVNKVYFVTFGHLPKWLNVEHPKLKIVRHEDFIPDKYLPTFSSRAIDLNLHRIPGLSEHFVYFNDDTFLTREVKKEDFFKNGLPCDSVSLNINTFIGKDQDGNNIVGSERMFMAPIYNTAIINYYFKKNEVLKKHFTKWFNPKYGLDVLKTIYFLPWPKFTGFKSYHIPFSYKKETYETLWELEEEVLDRTCSHKFRQSGDVNHYLMSYWQIVRGEFSPRSVRVGKRYNLKSFENGKDINQKAYKAISSQKYKMICINDQVFKDKYFEQIQKNVKNSFEKILPDKSKFEV